jgi:hypothetical protein
MWWMVVRERRRRRVRGEERKVDEATGIRRSPQI